MLRYGFTTGSCAAAAAKAATYMLLNGGIKRSISIDTPKGIKYDAEILDIKRSADSVSCAVKKDGGDDPDITTGLLIYAEVSFTDRKDHEIIIEGGKGVGIVTKPGLDRPVGEAAINTVPRQMITKEVREVCRIYDHNGSLKVTVSVKNGEETAKKTFNPKLGIVGGISIIGTSGIVEPMSTQALLDTIKVELNQRKEMGFDYVAVSPGNYGLDHMKNTYGYDLDKSVKCSNFIGKTVDMATEAGFKKILYVGHVGKLIKVAGGIMNTHSKEADCRMEILASLAIRHDAPYDIVKKILDCVSTEEAIRYLKECNKCDEVMKDAAVRICDNLDRRSGFKIETQCIVFTKEFGELAISEHGAELIKLCVEE